MCGTFCRPSSTDAKSVDTIVPLAAFKDIKILSPPPIFEHTLDSYGIIAFGSVSATPKILHQNFFLAVMCTHFCLESFIASLILIGRVLIYWNSFTRSGVDQDLLLQRRLASCPSPCERIEGRGFKSVEASPSTRNPWTLKRAALNSREERWSNSRENKIYVRLVDSSAH